MENNQSYHIPVLLNECIDALEINPDGTYIDVTFGGGGHSREIFKQLSPKGTLIAFDQDQDAKKNTWEADNFIFIPANFEHISNHLRMLGIKKVDGILADLGVSSHQFDEVKRGFSFRGEAKLDMRMNQNSELSARDLINDYTEEELVRIFRSYGEIKNARKLATAIVSARLTKKIKTTGDLTAVLDTCAPKYKEHKYFAQVFQAVRIEVNHEMSVLESFLTQCEKHFKSIRKISHHVLSFFRR